MRVLRRSAATTREVVVEARRQPVRRARPASRDHNAEVCEHLQAIAILDEQRAELDRQQKDIQAKIEDLMKEGRLEAVDDGAWKATYKETTVRGSTDIDVVKFKQFMVRRNMAAEFEECLKVSVTDAKQYLSEAEMKKVATVVEATKGPHTLKIERIKKKG